MQEELKRILNKKPNIEDALKMQLNIKGVEKQKTIASENRSHDFASKINEVIHPHHTAKEMVEKLVRSALEVEYGASFTASKGFGDMVSKIADVIITNPELRRQALSIASNTIEQKKAEKNDRPKKS